MSLDLSIRLRRNRRTAAIRKLVQETELNVADLIVPLFLIEGHQRIDPIKTMPGIDRLTLDLAFKKIDFLSKRGIQSIALFPSLDHRVKSDAAEEAWNPDSFLNRSISEIKERFPDICLICDVALDPYTVHGHDGLVNETGEIINDESVECLVKMAIVQAQSGIDIVAPSDMMDGRIGAIRAGLDQEGFQHVSILAYSAKYATSLYAPFRDALNVRLKFGDKKTYQMDPANVREALLEAQLDEEEGADILMVKPATFYLDVIAKLRASTHRPIAAYHISGEYSMVMAAAQAGYLDAPKVFHEALLCIKRAGADMIFTYAAEQVFDLL
jgi:porphobilinogen synthase